MRSLVFAVLIAFTLPALAIPIVSVDVDPSTVGIQSSIIVAPGTVGIAVDIVIVGVDVISPLNAFELDLAFAPGILAPTSVVNGGFLLAPIFVVQTILGATEVEFAEVTLQPAGAVGAGVLATIMFDAIGLGTSALDLNNLLLSAPFGIPIIPAAVTDGEVIVQGAMAVPEPGTLVLLSVGLLGMGLVGYRKKI